MQHAEKRETKGGDDNELMLIGVGVLAIIVGSAWLAKESDVFIGWWKMFYLPQAKAIAWFSTTFIGELINPILGHTSSQALGLVQFIEATPAHDMTGHFCWAASTFIGQYYLFVFVPVAGYITIKTYQKTQGESVVYQRFKNVREFTKFARKNALDAHELLDEIHKVGNEGEKNGKNETFNPETLPSSLSLIDFAKNNDLFKKQKNEDANNMRFSPKKASKCFINQLGREFTYIEDLINQPYGWVAIKIIQFIPEKYRAQIFEEVSRQHLYDFTVLIGLLESARKYGVVPSSLFIRLKQHYPSLWYGLNNLGRKVYFVEGLGLFAQYLHEIFQKQSNDKKPQLCSIQSAVESVEQSIQALEIN